ncbi:hypothetical protein MPHL43239_15045 [Mycolicibacterium phlei DSM 43239 = CCUG 21000]|nr:hypothetical protein MPHL43239_15045 [Mycolicibacterium phlei DSM 43239 = CCUG 21000]
MYSLLSLSGRAQMGCRVAVRMVTHPMLERSWPYPPVVSENRRVVSAVRRRTDHR